MPRIHDLLIGNRDEADVGWRNPRLRERRRRQPAERGCQQHDSRAVHDAEARSLSLSVTASSMASRKAWLLIGPLRTRSNSFFACASSVPVAFRTTGTTIGAVLPWNLPRKDAESARSATTRSHPPCLIAASRSAAALTDVGRYPALRSVESTDAFSSAFGRVDAGFA